MKPDPKIVLVTGAGSGFGRITSRVLADAGHTVYASMRDLAGRNAHVAEELRTEVSSATGAIVAVQLDVRSEAQARSLVDRILAERGRIDVVVSSAAVLMTGVLEAFSDEQLLDIYDANVLSLRRINRAVFPAMRRQGSGLHVYIGSAITLAPEPFTGAYAMTKAAADMLAQVMLFENTHFGIDATIVMPGVFTQGNNFFAHAVGPTEHEVLAQYDAIGDVERSLVERLDSLNVAGARDDQRVVAEAIRDVIALPAGTRPFRIVVDPQGRGLEEVNAARERMHRAYLARLGVAHMMDVKTSPLATRGR